MLSVSLDKADRISLTLPTEFHQNKVLTCILSRRNRNITLSKVFIFLITLNRSGIIEIDMENEDSCFKKCKAHRTVSLHSRLTFYDKHSRTDK